MRCGYKTNTKARYDSHLNRKYPCKDSREDQVDIDRLSSERSLSDEAPTKTELSHTCAKNQEHKSDENIDTDIYKRTVEKTTDKDGNIHTVINNDIDLNIHIDYKLLLREDLGQVMKALLNEPNNIEPFKDLYQIKVPMRAIHEEYSYPKIISMFDDYVMFMNTRKKMKTFTDTDNKNLLSFAPGLFNGIYLHALLKSESASSRINDIFSNIFVNAHDHDEHCEQANNTTTESIDRHSDTK